MAMVARHLWQVCFTWKPSSHLHLFFGVPLMERENIFIDRTLTMIGYIYACICVFWVLCVTWQALAYAVHCIIVQCSFQEMVKRVRVRQVIIIANSIANAYTKLVLVGNNWNRCQIWSHFYIWKKQYQNCRVN